MSHATTKVLKTMRVDMTIDPDALKALLVRTLDLPEAALIGDLSGDAYNGITLTYSYQDEYER